MVFEDDFDDVFNLDAESDELDGKSEAQEKRNRVKTRVLADSLISLISGSQKVLIMGHANMDMDALGACLGMKAICNRLNKYSRIVVDLKNTEAKTRAALTSSFGKEELEKTIVNSREAEDIIDGSTLLVVVDVHIPSMVMAPRLVDKAAKIVVIDHHRRAEEYIESPVFNHIDPAASSACELISEFIRFASINPKIELPSTYATIMLSGIFLDSSYFKSKSTGIRTFEAATILKEYGADNSLADDFLKDDYEEYKEVTEITTNLETPFYGVVIATGKQDRLYDYATIAKAANTCLTYKGVHAAFQQLNEWLTNRIFLAAAEDAVFENVKNTRAVVRQGPESDGKDLVFFVVVQKQNPAASGIMAEFYGVGL